MNFNEFLKNENKIEYINTLNKSSILELKSNCDNTYFNSSNSSDVIDDNIYDHIVSVLKNKFNYLDLNIGHPILCSAKNKKELPVWLGSLNKIFNTNPKELNNWINKHSTENSNFIVEEKLDGVSCLLDYSNKKLKLYTRGNGSFGTDISHLSKYIQNIPKLDSNILLRGELIISKEIFEEHFKNSYSNCRNMLSGCINSQKFSKPLNYLEFIGYELINDSLCNHEFQLKKLKFMNFKIPENLKLSELNCENLSESLINLKSSSKYDIDGIVIYTDSKNKRNTSGNPKYCFAFKINSIEDSIITTVEDVIWTPSKWGVLKPRIKLKEVICKGVKINYATGFNAKYIVDNSINKGSTVRIVRSGDVIPYISEIIESSESGNLPDCYYEWNKTLVDIFTTDKEPEITIKKIVSFFSNLEIKFLSLKTVEKLYKYGMTSILKICQASIEDFMKIDTIEQKSAERIYNNIHNTLSQLPINKVLSASHIFGKGISFKKLKLMFDKFPNIIETYKVYKEKNLKEKLLKINGYSEKTVNQIYEKLKDAEIFIDELKPFIKKDKRKIIVDDSDDDYSDDKIFKDMKFVFTGKRNKELQNEIEKLGGDVINSISKNVNFLLIDVYDLENKSSKVVKCEKLNIEILEHNKFIEKFNLF